MRNRFKVILSIILVFIIFFIVLLVSLSFKHEDKIVYKTLDTIDNYNYTLQDRDTKLMEEVFKKLKEVLENDEIDYKLYATYLSELYIIDLFTLDNKDNKYDVGSLEYVYSDIRENYILNVEDTLYKYIVDISSDDREELPIVSEILEKNIEETTYTYNEIEYDAYIVSLSWNYVKDLGYPTKGEIIIIKDNNKLFVVSYKGVEE